ncbi:MAG TPA: NAD-dependent epimerase/dehydratase family protein, partial [Terriglobales bacterium]
LSYLVKAAMSGKSYTIYGYKGKQVRDQIHSHDVIRAFEAFAANPRRGEAYNLGGGRGNSASVLECIALIEEFSGRKINFSYVEQNRRGDHICYISDLRKIRAHYPEWSITRSLRDILKEMVGAEETRAGSGAVMTADNR